MVQLDVLSTFFIASTVCIVVLSVLSAVVLFRLGRILGRIDRMTEDARHVFQFFQDLKESAIVSGLSMLIEKLVLKGDQKNEKKSKRS